MSSIAPKIAHLSVSSIISNFYKISGNIFVHGFTIHSNSNNIFTGRIQITSADDGDVSTTPGSIFYLDTFSQRVGFISHGFVTTFNVPFYAPLGIKVVQSGSAGLSSFVTIYYEVG